jgi:hypothetical protein
LGSNVGDEAFDKNSSFFTSKQPSGIFFCQFTSTVSLRGPKLIRYMELLNSAEKCIESKKVAKKVLTFQLVEGVS